MGDKWVFNMKFFLKIRNSAIFIYQIFQYFNMKFKKIPFSVWVYVGGIVALGVVGQVINHIQKKSKK